MLQFKLWIFLTLVGVTWVYYSLLRELIIIVFYLINKVMGRKHFACVIEELAVSLYIQDIKSLFPQESKPFYAGFGNRDTDELSYLKVGIPRGKIFIINPKVPSHAIS
jgi:hypothetical protein